MLNPSCKHPRIESEKYFATTDRADRTKLENAIHGAYLACGLEPPQKVVWLASPLECANAVNLVHNQPDGISGGLRKPNSDN